MIYNFDQKVDRRGTHTYKMDRLPKGNCEDAVSVWVADMDLPCAEPVLEAIHRRVDRQIFGYTVYQNEELKDAVYSWFCRRHNWEISKDWMFFSPGVVPAIAFLINELTEEGDGIIIQRPVYYPFTNIIDANKRTIVNNPLVRRGNTYVMDYEDLEHKFAASGTKGMILCSPHNPVGRVWTEEELKKVVSIAKKYDKWIISDEIHCDLTRSGVVHTPLLKVAPEYREQIIVCTAPSKTFNLAGLCFSNIIIPNEAYQRKWSNLTDKRFSVSACNPLSMTATIAAYNEGEDWLEQVRRYIDGNIQYIEAFVKEKLPKAQVIDCQGTYLVWIDLSPYCSDPEKLEHLMQTEAKVAFDEGYIFGPEGNGFERINVATQRAIVEECMKRMHHAVDLYRKGLIL